MTTRCGKCGDMIMQSIYKTGSWFDIVNQPHTTKKFAENVYIPCSCGMCGE